MCGEGVHCKGKHDILFHWLFHVNPCSAYAHIIVRYKYESGRTLRP